MKLLHTSVTVKDMDRSIKFYTEIMGMKLIRRHEIPQNNAEIAFLGTEGTTHNIELTMWNDGRPYTEGDQLDHIAFSVGDMDSEISKMRLAGVEIAKEPYRLGETRLSFIKDPNGIWIELIEEKE